MPPRTPHLWEQMRGVPLPASLSPGRLLGAAQPSGRASLRQLIHCSLGMMTFTSGYLTPGAKCSRHWWPCREQRRISDLPSLTITPFQRDLFLSPYNFKYKRGTRVGPPKSQKVNTVKHLSPVLLYCITSVLLWIITTNNS